MCKYDVIIVGSGLGGLVCAYILSRNGLHVAVVEKNKQIGGCLQTFTRQGVNFNTGMHYIGCMNENQILYQLFKYLHLLNDVPLQKLNTDGYDIVAIQDRQFAFANTYEHFTEALATQFPNHYRELQEYARRLQHLADESPLYHLDKFGHESLYPSTADTQSIRHFIAASVSNPLLQNVLVGNQLLYAGLTDRTPLYTYAMIQNAFIPSTYRIINGADQIATSLAKSIRSFGGSVFTEQEVSEFRCNDTLATAVRLANGEILEARYFISDLHPQVTLNMLHSPLLRPIYRNRINKIENTISAFTVYLKFKENTVPYLNYNYYYYLQPDVWHCQDYSAEQWPPFYLFMHLCHKTNPIYAVGAEILTFMRYEEVSRWANSHSGRRAPDYYAFKEEKAQKLLQLLSKSFPGITQNIEQYWTSTPLTYQESTHTPQGSMYGIVHDRNHLLQTQISERTKIPNLFLTGQNLNVHGALGVTVSALITCANIIGWPSILKDISLSEK